MSSLERVRTNIRAAAGRLSKAVVDGAAAAKNAALRFGGNREERVREERVRERLTEMRELEMQTLIQRASPRRSPPRARASPRVVPVPAGIVDFHWIMPLYLVVTVLFLLRLPRPSDVVFDENVVSLYGHCSPPRTLLAVYASCIGLGLVSMISALLGYFSMRFLTGDQPRHLNKGIHRALNILFFTFGLVGLLCAFVISLLFLHIKVGSFWCTTDSGHIGGIVSLLISVLMLFVFLIGIRTLFYYFFKSEVAPLVVDA